MKKPPGRFARWFNTVWPATGPRLAVIHEYGAMKQMPHVLADIAMRGGVWRPAHVANDPTTSAWNDGRRALALEILELVDMPPQQLLRLIDMTPERNPT